MPFLACAKAAPKRRVSRILTASPLLPSSPVPDAVRLVGKADNGSFSLVAQFRFCRSRHLESAVCNRDIVPLSGSRGDRAEIGFAPACLRRRSKAVHRFCGDRAAITCRFQPSWRTPEPPARPPFLLGSLPRFSPSCAPDEQLARCNVRCLDPLTDDILHPCRHRDRAGVACLPFRLTMAQWSSRC